MTSIINMIGIRSVIDLRGPALAAALILTATLLPQCVEASISCTGQITAVLPTGKEVLFKQAGTNNGLWMYAPINDLNETSRVHSIQLAALLSGHKVTINTSLHSACTNAITNARVLTVYIVQ